MSTHWRANGGLGAGLLAASLLFAGPSVLRAEPAAPAGGEAAGPSAARLFVDRWSGDHIAESLELYRHFHAHPELSLQETETARRVAEALESAGYRVRTGVGGTGVV
ncbi:MAG: hypothetical protein NZ990_01265, partial [Myxococcota bacterium]|nr:hypothetical protein [Myxococcota bacterium]